MIFKKLPLLLKITMTYLIFVIPAFLLSGKILIDKADEFIEKKVEHDFYHKREDVIKKLGVGVVPSDTRDLIVKEVDSDYLIKDHDSRRVVYDTDYEDYQLYRVKEVVVEVDGRYFSVTIRKHIDDLIELKRSVKGGIISIFICLVTVLILMSFIFSYLLFKPFNKILEQMKKFRLGKSSAIESVKTGTAEFNSMEQMFHKMVEASERDYKNLKEYTEDMAHELQTPLGIIRNKTEILIEDKDLMYKHPNVVKSIYDEVNHLSKLGSTLKLLTKIENSEFVNFRSLNTRHFLEEKLYRVKELADLKSIKIETDLCDNHYFVIDSFLLDILFKNLISNAIIYTPEEGIIKIETSDRFFRISNTGLPFEGDAAELFKRFKKRGGSSLGLGLAILKRICDLNKLSIQYKWEEGFHSFTISKTVLKS